MESRSLQTSVIVPAFNEERTLAQVVDRIMACGVAQEVVVVDDGSTDGTGAVLDRLLARWPGIVRGLRHQQNRGKGAAIRSALPWVSGELVIVQDADLELDPGEYPALLAPFASPHVQVVYGSRTFCTGGHPPWFYYLGGRLLSLLASALFGVRITDEATGFKVFRTGVLRSIGLECEGFEFCPEVTAKVLRQGLKIHEVPVSYYPRSRAEGKKIRWTDGFIAAWTLVRHRFGSTPFLPASSSSSGTSAPSAPGG